MNYLQNFLIWLRYKREIWLLWLIGVIVLAFVDLSAIQWLQREQAYRQILMTQQLQARFQSEIKEHITALNSLSVVYQNLSTLSNEDFQRYAMYITSNSNGFQQLFYINPDRVVTRAYPLPKNHHQIVAIISSKEFDSLLQNALKSRYPVVSNLVRIKSDKNNTLIVIPIYRHHTREFTGFAAGILSLKTIWQPLGKIDFLKNYQTQITDPIGHSLFDNISLSHSDRIITRLPLRIADKHWSIWLQPVQPTFNALMIQRILLWTIGLTIISLIHLLAARSKRYKINLVEAQKQFETIFEVSPDGILLLGENLSLQLTNPPIEKWSGLKHWELKKKSFFELFSCKCPHLEQCRELSYLLCTKEQFEKNLPEILEAEITSIEDKVTRILRFNSATIRKSGSGQPQNGFICILGDISSAKELEKIKESHVATLTHDLKTPLLAQEIVLETILSGKSGQITSDQKKLLTGASASVKDLLEMVNSILLYYKIESEHLDLVKQSVSLCSIMDEVIKTLQPLLEKRHLGIIFENSADIPYLEIDPLQMKRVFHNLISNAINYARQGTNITIVLKAYSTEGYIMLSILNEGKGIAAKDLARIFDKYYSLSRKFKQIGTGLGLYISRKIVELHGGKIWAESIPGKTTCFYVELPANLQNTK